MDISFTPPLAKQISLSIPPAHSTATLNFTAIFNSAYHAQSISDGAILQLWSDVRLETEEVQSAYWRAFDFQTPKFPIAGSMTEVSLVGTEGNTTQHDSLLSLQLCVPLSSRSYLFSFTYRLVYPSGEIKWLGEYGHNGTILLEPSQTSSRFVLYDGWSVKNGGYVWTSPSGKSVDNLEIARLSDLSDYSVQMVGRESFLDSKKASLAFLVPRISSLSVLLDPTYVLSASPAVTFTISPSGVITASGAGSILMRAPGSSTTSDLHSSANNLMAHCSSNDVFEASILDTGTDHLLLASGWEGTRLLHTLVLPVIPRQLATAGPIRIALNKLAALLPDDVTQNSIFSPSTLNIHFFRRHDKDTHLLIDPSGGSFVLTPVFNLKDGQYQLSILSYSASIRSQLYSEIDPGNLPTPPPSPRPHSSPSLSSREKPRVHTAPSAGPDSLSLARNPFEGTFRRQIQTPALRTILSAYIISMATFLFAPLYHLLFGRFGEAISEFDARQAHERLEASGQVRPEDHDSIVKRESDSQATSATSESLAAEDYHKPRQLPHLGHSLLVETRGGRVMAALRSTDVTVTTLPITVESNGRKLDPTFTKLDDCTSLLGIDGGIGGLLKISLA